MMNLKCILYVFGIFLFNKTIAENYTAEYKSHSSTDFDITVVYSLRGNSTNSNKCPRPDRYFQDFKNLGCDGVQVHSRTNAIGLPIAFNGRVLRSENKDLEFIVDSYESYFTTNLFECDKIFDNQDSTTNAYAYRPFHRDYEQDSDYEQDRIYEQTTKYYERMDEKSLNEVNELDCSSKFKISWTPKETVEGCVSITYKLLNYEDYILTIYERNNSDPMISHSLKFTDDLETLILRTKSFFLKNSIYDLIISLTSRGEDIRRLRGIRFGIKRISECNNDGEIYEISGSEIGSSQIHKAEVYNIENNYKQGMLRYVTTTTRAPSTTKRINEKNDSVYPKKECKSNRFGADCSGVCSTRHKTFCRHKLFCSSHSGCSCASGYTGRFCDQNCPSGTFGRDCQQKCGNNCLNSCNVFTGVCLGGCKKNFISPNCIEKYPWLKSPPQLQSYNYSFVKLHLNFESENIDGSKQIPLMYYQIAYKNATGKLDFQYSDIKAVPKYSHNIIDKVENLNTGTEYTFGVRVITKDGNFNDEDMNTANYRTQCQVPKNIDYGLKFSKGANHIEVTWQKLLVNDTFECEITGYAVKVINNGEETVQEIKTEENNYVFHNLQPASEYAVQVTALVRFGSVEPSAFFYETTDVRGYISVQNVTAKLLDSDKVVHLTWELGDPYVDAPISFLVKHRINRNYSCSGTAVDADLWTENIVNNKTEYDIDLDYLPNVQYVIQVVPISADYYCSDDENVVFVQTESSTPKLAPVLDKSHPVYVTNDTARITWFVDKTRCMDLNGILTGYRLVLKNLSNRTQLTKETEDTTVELTDLIPNADYELQVCIRNEKGFDKDFTLSVPFKTRPKYLPSVEELTVYKKNTKTRSVALRWSYPNDSDVNGFILQTSANNQKAEVNQITIEPVKCKAWPKSYCTAVNNTIPGVEYTVKVKAKSTDYPSGGLPASVSFNTIDGSPDEPGNLRTTHVGARSVSLQWDIPWILNGVLKSFIINAEEVSAIDVDSCCVSLPVMELQETEELPAYNYTIDNLKPGSTYTIGVLAKNSWYGQAKKIYVTTTLLDTTSETNVFNTTGTNK